MWLLTSRSMQYSWGSNVSLPILAGLSYDGLYYVKSVTTNLKKGELKQNFTLSRNGLISLTPRVIP